MNPMIDSSITEKRCSACKRTKFVSEFTYDSDHTRLKSRCNDCLALYRLGLPPAIAEKTCSKCEQPKPLTEFHADKYNLDGKHSWCKGCIRVCQQARREVLKQANQTRGDKPTVTEQRCGTCRTIKPADSFARKRGRPSGLSAECKDCEATYRKEYNQRPAVKVQKRIYQRQFAQTPKGKAYAKDYNRSENGKATRKRAAIKLASTEEGQKRLKKYKREHFQRVKQIPEQRRKMKDRQLRRAFGITYDDYERMYAAQNGVCAICGRPPKKAHHHHLQVDHDHATGQIRALLCGSCNRGLGNLQDDPVILEAAKQYLLAHRQLRLVV